MRYMALVLIVLSANACLDKLPGDAYADGDWTGIRDAEQEMIGTYALMKSSALYSGYLTLLPDLQADLAYAVEGFSNTNGDIWQWKLRSTTREIESVYASLYTVIGQCNHYLDKYEKLRPTLVIDSQIDALDSWTGEIYGMRALCYSELIKCFCQAYPMKDGVADDEAAKKALGVVLRTSYYKEEIAKRSSLFDSWALVFDDLAKAESMIDEDEDNYNTVWFTRAAAYALHARVALYTGKWADAVTYSTKVIDSGDFRLADASANYTSDTDVLTGTSRNLSYYQYLWDYDSSFEIILKVGFTPTSYGGSLGQIFHNYNRGSRLFYPDYVPANWVVNLYQTGDLRQQAFFAMQQTGYSGYPSMVVLMKYFGNRTFISNAAIYHVNMPKVFRLSEQYLIRAEAYCRQSKYSDASADLTTMRKARFSGGSGAVSVGENNWLEQISNERVRELYMEGFRLNDLKRWGKGFTRTSQSYSLDEGSDLEIKAGDYRFVWPIPNHEVESPGTDIEQNPGY